MPKTRILNSGRSGAVVRSVQIGGIMSLTIALLTVCSCAKCSPSGLGRPGASPYGGRDTPACLLEDPMRQRTSQDLQEVFAEMDQRKATADLLETVVITELSPNLMERWLEARVRKHRESTTWYVGGQIISDDRLGASESIGLPPPFHHELDRCGRARDHRFLAQKGWGWLSGDLEDLGREAAKVVGARRGWAPPARPGANPVASPDTPGTGNATAAPDTHPDEGATKVCEPPGCRRGSQAERQGVSVPIRGPWEKVTFDDWQHAWQATTSCEFPQAIRQSSVRHRRGWLPGVHRNPGTLPGPPATLVVGETAFLRDFGKGSLVAADTEETLDIVMFMDCEDLVWAILSRDA